MSGRHATADAGDKRTGSRAPITLRVDYKRLNSFFADYTKNISKGGTFIKTTRPLPIGTEFVFVLHLPSTGKAVPETAAAGDAPPPSEPPRGTARLALRGVVRWCPSAEEIAGGKPPGMGIEFLFADDTERAKVHGFVEELMCDALGAHISARLLSRE